MLYKLEKRCLKKIDEQISIPKLIIQFINAMPEAPIELIDYDYVGEATDEDFTSFSTQLYDTLNPTWDIKIVCFTNELPYSKLEFAYKKYRPWFSDYPFKTKPNVHSVQINDNLCNNQTCLVSIQKVCNINDLKIAITYLFSCIYETQYLIFYSPNRLSESKLDYLLRESLYVRLNRHGYSNGVTISFEKLYRNKGDCKILYPYGGTDFGSLMLFEF